jgi:hypothetical protein
MRTFLQLSRIAKQAERMEGSRQQNGSKRAPGLPPTGASEQAGSGERQRAAVIASDEDATANGGALVPAAGTMDLREEIERLKQNNQALAMQVCLCPEGHSSLLQIKCNCNAFKFDKGRSESHRAWP